MKIRVLRSFYGREGSVRTGALLEVSENRATALIKKRLAVLVEEPARPSGKGAGPLGRGDARAGRKSAAKTAAKTAAKADKARQPGSRTGAAKPASSSRRAQAPRDKGSTGSEGGGNGSGGASAS